MNDPTPLDDLIADDLLLDRLAGRHPAGDEPVAALLCAVAAHADRPLAGRTRRRRAHGRRLFAAFAVITVGASGAGVAAAVTLPNYLPGAAERARVERMMDANAASNRPSVLLSRLGIPADADLGAERGLVLVRRADGRIVLVPAAAVSRAGEFSGAAVGFVGRELAGLTGTPQVPSPQGVDTRRPGGPAGDVGTAGRAGATHAPDEHSPTEAEALAGDVNKPAAPNNGKTGKGQAKDRTTTVTVTPPPTPDETPTPTETPTTQALVAPESTTGDTTSKKANRSAQDDTSVLSDGTDGTDESAPLAVSALSAQSAQSSRSPRSGQPAPPDQPDQPDQPDPPTSKPADSSAGSAPAKETTDRPNAAPSGHSGQSGQPKATKPAATASEAKPDESDPSGEPAHSKPSGDASTGESASAEVAVEAAALAADAATASS
jgi:hypothetical protein